ncbi:lipopolysaccharide biosynthesis protein [Weissella confusa]|uniref:lipopolysaccharide biosynthesis protein n=1 Tax=Weissella confusa TaxID=1583 RepID=UPI00223C46EF|nr:hypothetical protein [Weissella confusa]MCT0025106.1 hypothetical protein [Weissella confusa]
MDETSKKSSIKNVVFAGVALFIAFPVQFVSRYFLIKYFGIDFLGLTGVFNSIIGMINLADLGISGAIVFSLFKPVADKDWPMVRALLSIFKRIYFAIAGVVLLLGLAVVPFLDRIVASEFSSQMVLALYLMFVVGAASSYTLAYYQTILIVTERNHIISKVNLIWTYLLLGGQIFAIVFLDSKFVYVFFVVFLGFLSNISLRHIVRKSQPEIVSGTTSHITQEQIKQIKANVFGNFLLRLSGVVVTSTDSLLISAFVGLSQVGIYSNYLILTNFLQKVIVQVLGSLTGNIGVFATKNTGVEGERLFQRLQFFNYLVLNIAVFAIIGAINPFIGLWIGQRYTLDNWTLILIGISFYVMNYRALGWSFTAAYGLADKMKKTAVMEMMANIIFSLTFLVVFKLGLKGVILGTIFSTLLTVAWQNPVVIYKYAFGISVKGYFRRYLINIVGAVVGGFGMFLLGQSIVELNDLLRFIIQVFAAVGLGTCVSLLMYRRSTIVKEILKKRV